MASILGFIVLPASMSRAAWIAFVLAMLVLGFQELGLKSWMLRRKLLSLGICMIAVCFMIGIFFIKKDSAVGRLHIWHMEQLAMRDNFWHGTGAGTVLGTYGKTQAAYFENRDRSAIVTRVAGCPEYAFNEYFRIGIEYGVPAMILAMTILALVIGLLLHMKSPVAYGLIAFSVFAFCSYPMDMFRQQNAAERQWLDSRYLLSYELYDEAVETFAGFYDDLNKNYRFLYDYGYALHKAGKYSESNTILEKGTVISSDPMFHNIMGKNYEYMELYEEAEHEYLTAHYMVPCRIYPLILLMEMNIKRGRLSEASALGKKILSMPINEKNRTMVFLVERARTDLLSIESSLKGKQE